MSEVIGRVTIEGDPAQIALVKAMFEQARNLPGPLAELFKRDYRVIPLTPAELIAKGAVLPSGKAAWGFTPGAGKQWLNSRLMAKRPGAAKYAACHEVGHAIGISYLTDAKVAELRQMLGPRTRYGKYANSFSEAYADAFAEACGFFDPLDDFYRDFPDENLDDLIAITFRPDPEPPVILPPPLVLPLPDPELVAALDRAAVAEADLAVANAKIAAAQSALA